MLLYAALAGLSAGTSLLAAANPLNARLASPFNTFVSQDQKDVQLRYVTDSGVCETTPGVRQISGYVDIGTNMSMVSQNHIELSVV